MKNCSECNSQNEKHCAHGIKKNKHNFFTPNQDNINNFKSAKKQKKRQWFSIHLLLLSLAIITSFFLFHEALVFVTLIGAMLIVVAAKTHLNSQQYHSLCDSKTMQGNHQCLFCGNHGIYRSSPHKTNITECRCSKCKQHLFNE